MASVRGACSKFGLLFSPWYRSSHKISEFHHCFSFLPIIIPTSNLCSDTPAKLDNVSLAIQDGRPVITVPLPSTREVCRFPLQLLSDTVGDLLTSLHNEDSGVNSAAIYDSGNVRLSKSTNIDTLIRSKFKLVLNGKEYVVEPPDLENLPPVNINSSDELKTLINQLYNTMGVKEHQLAQEARIKSQLRDLTDQLEPYEQICKEMQIKAEKHTSHLAWFGMGLMGVQLGFLARLTWWEYSWDIMEPVTYFITYGTTMAMFAYYVVTKQEYNFPLVKDRQFLISFHKYAKKRQVDLKKYNEIKEAISQAEIDLKRLRDPLQRNLPIQQIEKPPRLE